MKQRVSFLWSWFENFHFVNNKTFQAKVEFIIPVEKFNMSSQKYFGLQDVSHLKGLKLAVIRAKEIKVLLGE